MQRAPTTEESTPPLQTVESDEEVSIRLDNLEQRFDKIQDQFSEMEYFFQSLDDVPKRLVKLETKLKNLMDIIAKLVQKS